MSEAALKRCLGIFLVVSHFGLVGYIFIIFNAGGFKFDDMTTTVAIIVPMFAGYTAAVLKTIVKNRLASPTTTVIVTKEYAALSFLLPTVFTSLLGFCIHAQAHGTLFKDFEQFKQAVLLVESLFAVYVGLFVFSLFIPQAD